MPKRVAVTYNNEQKLEPYLNALRMAGLDWVLMKAGEEHGEPSGGLLLTGGTDIDPRYYSQPPHSAAEPPDTARDEMELRLLASALERDLPVLAICRGLQLLHVAGGGALEQHIEGHRHPGVAEAHPVDVIAESKLARIVGAGIHMVNSRHHQAAGASAGDLLVTARSPDGCVEAVERPGNRFVIGVQWHPEDLIESHAESRKLFLAFAEAI
jgi:putative glutamine amidotransferase